MKKIISLSCYGTNPRYIVGAARQYELAKEFYPDWNFRLYTDNISNFNDLKDAELIDMSEDKTNGMYWSRRALFESEDNITLIRGADGRITKREQRAVLEWLDSDKKFHTIKDHDAHYEFPIIGDIYGYKGKFNTPILNLMNWWIKNDTSYLSDQIWLREVIYPVVKDSILLHSMDAGWFGETRAQLSNPYGFCGNGWDENDMPIYAASLAEHHRGHDPKNLSKKFKFVPE